MTLAAAANIRAWSSTDALTWGMQYNAHGCPIPERRDLPKFLAFPTKNKFEKKMYKIIYPLVECLQLEAGQPSLWDACVWIFALSRQKPSMGLSHSRKGREIGYFQPFVAGMSLTLLLLPKHFSKSNGPKFQKDRRNLH